MDRTLGAALLAAVITFGAVAGVGVFLGLGSSGSLIAGVVLGLLAGLLLLGASRRAETFHEPTPPSPRVPLDHDDDTRADRGDPARGPDADDR